MRNLPFGWDFLIFSFLLKSNFSRSTFRFFTENVVPLQLIDRQNEKTV